MSASSYEDLRRHVGHTLACVTYADANVAVECEDCSEVLLDFDRATAPADERWNNDSIQFPRLLAEIVATQDNIDDRALCESMDLEPAELDELFERAQARWDRIKEAL